MIREKDLTEKVIQSGVNKIYGTVSGGIVIQFNDNTYLDMDTVTNKIGIPKECMDVYGVHVLFKLVRFMNLRDLFYSLNIPYVKMNMEYDNETNTHIFRITPEEDVDEYVVRIEPLSEGGDVNIESSLQIPQLSTFVVQHPLVSETIHYRLEHEHVRAIAALTDNENVTRVYRKYLQVDKIPPEERFN